MEMYTELEVKAYYRLHTVLISTYVTGCLRAYPWCYKYSSASENKIKPRSLNLSVTKIKPQTPIIQHVNKNNP
jgi:hypothetical protein